MGGTGLHKRSAEAWGGTMPHGLDGPGDRPPFFPSAGGSAAQPVRQDGSDSAPRKHAGGGSRDGRIRTQEEG